MKPVTYLRNHVAAAGGALLIATASIAGLAILTHVEEVCAAETGPGAIVRMAPIVVTVKRLAPIVERMAPIVITASRYGSDNFATANARNRDTRMLPAAQSINRKPAISAETKI